MDRGLPDKAILIVEDNPDIRDTFRMLFELEGYDVRVAGNGEEALDRLDDETTPEPSLILLDLSMPVMDGRTFLDVLESRGDRHIPVMVLSAEVDAAVARELKSRYGVRVLRKPAPVDVLLAVARTSGGTPPTLH